MDFNQSNYFYGIGYPLFNIIFYPLNNLMLDKFFFLNVIFLIIFVSSMYYMLQNFGFKVMNSITLTAIGLSPVMIYYVTSFNNIVTISSFSFLLFFYYTSSRKTYGYLILGVLVGLVFATRYADVIFFIPLICYMFWRELVEKNLHLKNLILFIVPCLFWIGVVLFYHDFIFGSIIATPYDTHVRNINGIIVNDKEGYYLNKIFLALYEIFINPYILLPRDQVGDFYSLIKYIPTLPFVFIGLGYLVGKKIISISSMWIILGTVGFALVYYGSFWAVGALELKYYNLRYFSFIYPCVFIGSIVGIYSLLNIFKEELLKSRSYITGLFTTVLLAIIVLAFPTLNQLALNHNNIDASKFRITANESASGTEYLFDSNNKTRFTTNQMRDKGQFIKIDFNKIETFSEIRIDSTHYADDRSNILSFYVSDDGNSYKSIQPIKVWFTGNNWFYKFEGNMTQYLKIVNMDKSSEFYWSISDLYIKK
ncbi:discoidin domain-containing protein [Paenibacillus polymyxa]|uniref:discoidin domain-containing protein n=1 Tax=Paenibacillus polymyxa TaxID=1406 RepID=UPI002378E7C9|nr:discoidin domain-containing protein [Paenibacillus polymyxa]WDM21576.1 discoidin domain-containing protein [Paenibacillus polymyxa]